MELHFEMYSQILNRHPFFRCYTEVNPAGIRKLCHSAVSPLSMHTGDEVFHAFEKTHNPRMFFVLNGELQYYVESTNCMPVVVTNKHWLSEATLWTSEWVHLGTLRASTECQLLALDSCKFQTIVSAFTSQHAGNYARDFVEFANYHLDEQTDGGECHSFLQDIIFQTFPDVWPRVKDEFIVSHKGTTQRSRTKRTLKNLSADLIDA